MDFKKCQGMGCKCFTEVLYNILKIINMKLEPYQKIGTMPPKLIALIKEEARRISYPVEVEDLDINAALYWSQTTQGQDFWNALYNGGEMPEEFLEGEEYTIF